MGNTNLLIKKLNNREIVLLSGGMGTEILRRGVSTKMPLWSTEVLFTHPEVVEQIHIDYIKAGAKVITTNTFRTQKRTLAKVGKGDQAREITILACKLAKNAVKKTGKTVLIAGSIAPLEDCYSPELTPPDDEPRAEHLEHAQNLKEGGVDFLLIETMITQRETLAAIFAAKSVGLPFAVSFCCNDKFQLLSGEDLGVVVKEVEKFEPLFISINCINQEIVNKTIKKLKEITKYPIGAYAQGDGDPDDGQGWTFSTNKKSIEGYIKNVKEWIKSGAQIIGGCCGTTPEYIKALANLIDKQDLVL